MNKTFWVIEKPISSYVAVNDNHQFVWTLDIQQAIKFYSELSAMNAMFSLEKLIPNFFPAAPYAAEHMFFERL